MAGIEPVGQHLVGEHADPDDPGLGASERLQDLDRSGDIGIVVAVPPERERKQVAHGEIEVVRHLDVHHRLGAVADHPSRVDDRPVAVDVGGV